MKNPKIILSFTIFASLCLLAQDLLVNTGSFIVQIIQDIAFVTFGFTIGMIIALLKSKSKKTSLIDSSKLAIQLAEDETKQLQEKVKTLEVALQKAIES